MMALLLLAIAASGLLANGLQQPHVPAQQQSGALDVRCDLTALDEERREFDSESCLGDVR